MNCPNCGKETFEGALYCMGCGGRVDGKEVAAEISMPADALETIIDQQVDAAKEVSVDEKNNEDEKKSLNETFKETEVRKPALFSEAAGEEESGKRARRKKTAEEIEDKVREAKKIKSIPRIAKPIKSFGFFWREIVCLIPLVNIIVLFVLAFAEGININSRSYARAKLIKYLIFILCLSAGTVFFFLNSAAILEWLSEVFAIWYENLNS